jgi:hypothetical protein
MIELLSTVTLVRLEQFLKPPDVEEKLLILIPDGIKIDVRLEQPLNALPIIVVRVLGTVTADNVVHPLNADSLIADTQL